MLTYTYIHFQIWVWANRYDDIFVDFLVVLIHTYLISVTAIKIVKAYH